MVSKLIHDDGHEIQVGDEVIDFRGNKLIVCSWKEGQTPESTGRVYVKEANSDWEQGYFPSVIDAHIVVE